MRRAHVVEVKPVPPELLLPGCAWVAIDSRGQQFGGDTEAEARTACERYNAGKNPYPNARALPEAL